MTAMTDMPYCCYNPRTRMREWRKLWCGNCFEIANPATPPTQPQPRLGFPQHFPRFVYRHLPSQAALQTEPWTGEGKRAGMLMSQLNR
ncbi:hypothetical protein M3J09_001041 [Ascochyta lentis]